MNTETWEDEAGERSQGIRRPLWIHWSRFFLSGPEKQSGTSRTRRTSYLQWDPSPRARLPLKRNVCVCNPPQRRSMCDPTHTQRESA
eukprot:1881559-Pyramimonas_sp.AAC.1